MTRWLWWLAVLVAALVLVREYANPSYPVHARGAVVISGASSGIGRDAALSLLGERAVMALRRAPCGRRGGDDIRAGVGYDVFAGVRNAAAADAFRAAAGSDVERAHPVSCDEWAAEVSWWWCDCACRSFLM